MPVRERRHNSVAFVLPVFKMRAAGVGAVALSCRTTTAAETQSEGLGNVVALLGEHAGSVGKVRAIRRLP